MNPRETYDLISDLIDQIDRTFVATSIVNNGDGTYKIYSENTMWLTKGYTIVIKSVLDTFLPYVITDLSFNEWILVSGEKEPNELEFIIYEPFFWHGTTLAQNEQMNLIPDSWDKLPMIWLHEITRERFEPDELLRLDRESDCDLYFLIDCNQTDWLTPDFDNYTVKPMRNLISSFIDVLKNSPLIGIDFRYDVLDYAKFGVYQTDKGITKQIFKDALSGSQLKITIPFLKENC